MRERGALAAVSGLIVLSVFGLAAIAWAPRWTPRADADAANRRTYVVGIFEDPSARNPWAINGPNSTTWNVYVAAGEAPVLFSYTVKDDWVPRLAADLPSPLQFDESLQLWRSTLHLKSGQAWSDGSPITAQDVAFTFNAVAAFGATKLGGRFPTLAPAELLAKVEARDELTVEFFLKKRDARYRFGILTSPFMLQRGFWEPHVKAALASADPVKAILDVDVVDEPVAGAFLQGTWERGSFVDRPVNRRFTGKNAIETVYPNGAVQSDDGAGHSWSGYGSPEGKPSAVVATGPHVDAVHYRVFGTQAAGVLALQSGEVSFLFNPLGLETGFEDQLKSTPGVTLIRNSANGIRFLGFNQRREPMRRQPFRQAVAVLIDREFITDQVLQGSAFPLSSIVPPASVAWFNPNLRVPGDGMSRAERIRESVRLLESGGFSWASKPVLAADGTLRQPGRGLRMPDGTPVRPLELICPTDAYDARRAAFAAWTARWMNEVGIPVRTVPLAFNVLLGRTDQQDMDMWILGFELTRYPTYLQSFFHSRYSGLRGHNAGGYSSAEYDRLADAFLEEVDDLVRAKELAFQLQETLNRDLPWIPLFSAPLIEAYRSDQVRYPFTSMIGGLQREPWSGFIDAVELVQ
jgi:peptide/nickel transport system substrate-binding protein